METATTTQRSLTGEKAAGIVDAMRASVARRGTAGSTFDHVAREAGVSRGLLHYYFGTKERLLVEVVRRDCDVRMELLDDQLATARTADDFVDSLVVSLESMLRDDPAFVTLIFELFTLSRRNDELAAEYAELLRRTREHVAGLLRAKESEGVLRLRADAEAVADVLFSLADGIALRMLGDPEYDHSGTIRAGVACARTLLDDRA
ncbi:MAG: TetR family transcriptional regulator C-terminal domain-containing protein [Solirubrobacterales bacterium]|nr:TetR family transcriptional regulator C-terminal domain-containing protein [Solirubrobacterales bacterium]